MVFFSIFSLPRTLKYFHDSLHYTIQHTICRTLDMIWIETNLLWYLQMVKYKYSNNPISLSGFSVERHSIKKKNLRIFFCWFLFIYQWGHGWRNGNGQRKGIYVFAMSPSKTGNYTQMHYLYGSNKGVKIHIMEIGHVISLSQVFIVTNNHMVIREDL